MYMKSKPINVFVSQAHPVQKKSKEKLQVCRVLIAYLSAELHGRS